MNRIVEFWTIVLVFSLGAANVGLSDTSVFCNFDESEITEGDLVGSSIPGIDFGESAVFVQPGLPIFAFAGRVMARIDWRAVGPIAVFPWTVSLDQVIWSVTE